MSPFDHTGWLVAKSGQLVLATSAGGYKLTGVAEGIEAGRPARVKGVRNADTVAVSAITVSDQAAPTGRRPRLVGEHASLGDVGVLRSLANGWLEAEGYGHVTLPNVWFRTEEYGAPEFVLDHPSHRGDDLRLLQSPELPLYAALAEGLGPSYTYSSCYRHEVVHDPMRDASYLMEFEQLVVASSFTSLEEMMGVGERFISHLAAQVGVMVDHSDYVRFSGQDSAPGAARDLPHFDDLILFTVPAYWGTALRGEFGRSLAAQGARILVVDDTGPRDLNLALFESAAEDEVRLAILPGDDADAVDAILAKADVLNPASPRRRITDLQWNPSWSMLPRLRWREQEQSDSSLPVRSFTSAQFQDSSGDHFIRDAELHVGGTEVVHIREYADVPSLLEQARTARAPGDYEYLSHSSAVAPPGMVGMFIGWERLVAVLLGLAGPQEAIAFPRRGNGELAALTGVGRSRALCDDSEC